MSVVRSAGIAAAAAAVALGAAATAAPAAFAGTASGSVSPSVTQPGTRVTFMVTCASLNPSSATLFGVTLGLQAQIPMRRGNQPGTFDVSVRLPSSISPGGYHPSIDCSDGSSTTVTLKVLGLPAGGAVPVQNEPPEGAAPTGDGTTSSATWGGPATAAGLGLVGFGAAVGGVAWRRRRSARRS